MISKYPMVRAFITKNSEFKVSDKFPNPFKNVDINDKKFLQIPNGMAIVSDYINFITRDGLNDIDPYDKLKIINKEIKNQVIKEQLAAEEAQYSLMFTDKLELYYQLFDSIVKNEDLKTPVKEKYVLIKALQPGSPSPDFIAYDINGKAYSLKDFSGKALYIDLWATWCSPCIAEIPHLIKLKERYKNKPIIMLSFNVYDHKYNWESFIKKKELKGWQLINTDKELDFLKKYVVDGIPRFILLDKNGKIVDADAPRPSNEKLIDLIDKTISE
jgi:thiol-disulfide isomerase/thioredoxin